MSPRLDRAELAQRFKIQAAELMLKIPIFVAGRNFVRGIVLVDRHSRQIAGVLRMWDVNAVPLWHPSFRLVNAQSDVSAELLHGNA